MVTVSVARRVRRVSSDMARARRGTMSVYPPGLRKILEAPPSRSLVYCPSAWMTRARRFDDGGTDLCGVRLRARRQARHRDDWRQDRRGVLRGVRAHAARGPDVGGGQRE